MSTHSHKVRSDHEIDLPEGPDELLGITEGGKSIVGIVLAVATLGFLVWLAATLALS